MIYGFPGVRNPTRTGLSVPIGSGRYPIALGMYQPWSCGFPVRLLGQQRLDLLLGLTLALKEPSQRFCDFFGCQEDRKSTRLNSSH